MSGRTAGWWSSSVGARMAGLSLALLLAIQVASFVAIRAGIAEHARSLLPARLAVGDRVLASLVERDAETLRQGAAVLAADYGFKTAVLSNDEETVASALTNHGGRLGATETALLGPDFAIRAAGSEVGGLAPVVARLSAQARAGRPASAIAVLGGQPHQVVLTPMKAPVTVGWVLMGFPLDRRLVDDMASLSALHLTLLTRDRDDAPWTVAMSGDSPARAEAFARAATTIRPAESGAKVAPPAAVRNAPGAGPGLHEVVVEGEHFLLQPRLLAPTVLALVSISVDSAIEPPHDLLLVLAVITVIGFGVFVCGSLFTARRVTEPLRVLSAAAERLGRGDSTTPVCGPQRDDEIGQLAQAFEQMRISIGEKQAQVLRLAYWDGLTGLPNRAQFRDAVRQAIEDAGAAGDEAGAETDARTPSAGETRRQSPPRPTVAVVMLDLDRFKHVNDVLGSRIGDLLLQSVAERLQREVVRSGDIVGRLGGDEFAVLLRGSDLAAARTIAARIGVAFDEPLVIEEHTVDMGAGIGIACWPEHAADADMLLGRAELAMYAAKRRTEGPLAYSPAFDASSTQTLSLLTELRRAIDQHEFRLYLQPKLALGSGQVRGAEALVRWLHPVRGLVPPMDFIPFAEQTGFVRTLTLWVFEEAVQHWLTLGGEGVALTVSVNLSTRDLIDLELPQKFEAVLARYLAPAGSFCLEITESAIMDDPQRSLATLNRLSDLGFRLSIDDFGTGYSSLAYLKRLPVDELKIDRSFVMNMVDDADDAKIVRSTIDLAHNLGLTVVAEGVENANVFDALRRLDCDEAQGYHMGRPMPATEFAAWSSSWSSRHAPRPEEAFAVLH